MIIRLFRINQAFLGNVLNTVSLEAYTLDMNNRFGKIKTGIRPRIEKYKGTKVDDKDALSYNLDTMKGVDKNNTVALINIAIEKYLSILNPIKLNKVDSLARTLLKKDNIDVPFYSRIIDKKTGKVIECSVKNIPPDAGIFPSVVSRDIPMNFEKTQVFQMVLLHPLRSIFSQMIGMLILSFLLTLFCIYCLYLLQHNFSKQKKLAQSKNDFYNQVSHELKRPISLFSKALDSLKDPVVIQNTEKRNIYLNMSSSELNRMSEKIDMILTMSMEEDGMFNLDITEFDIYSLVEEVKENMIIKAEKPVSININVHLENQFIYADKDHLYQCISNLVENSIKYSGKDVKIDITLDRKDNFVTISVLDNGYGISSNNLDRIFEKFERLKNIKKTPGYGIGLCYVKQIIEKHGGYVEVNSELGKWSEFIIKLPAKKV